MMYTAGSTFHTNLAVRRSARSGTGGYALDEEGGLTGDTPWTDSSWAEAEMEEDDECPP